MSTSRSSQSSYRNKKYSGPRKGRKRVYSALKSIYGEGVSRDDVWVMKKVQSLSYMKCVKCGSTNETDPTLSFYSFPCPDLEGTSKSAARCRAWAEYCWPDRVLTPEELTNVYKEKQLLCSSHFPDKETIMEYGLQSGVPTDFPGITKNPVRTYGKKVAATEETASTVSAENPKRQNIKAKKKRGFAKKKNLEGKKILEHDFLEGENTAELFATIDEVFEDGTDAEVCQDATDVLRIGTNVFEDGTNFFEDETDASLYETTVKKEPELEENCDKLLHDGYKCDLCLSSISGYRYTCVQCDDVDLCAACEASGAHDAHYVLRVPRPCPEEEIEELLNELRLLLKKRPPANQPAEKGKSPSNSVAVGEDPLEAAPASPGARSEDQSESEDESSESESENVSLLKHRSHTDPPVLDTSHKGLNLRARKTTASKETEIISSKRRKLNPDKRPVNATITRSKVVKEVRKSINFDTSYDNSDTDEVSNEIIEETRNLDNALQAALKARKLKAALKSENDIKPLDTNENDFELVAENNLRTSDQKVQLDQNESDKYIESSDGLSDQEKVVHNIRRQKGLNTQHLQETLDEEPLDFILQKNFNLKDPLATTVPTKAKIETYKYLRVRKL